MTRYKAITAFALAACFGMGAMLVWQQSELIEIEEQSQRTLKATKMLLQKSVDNFETLKEYVPEVEVPVIPPEVKAIEP